LFKKVCTKPLAKTKIENLQKAAKHNRKQEKNTKQRKRKVVY